MNQVRVRDEEFLGPLTVAATAAQREEIDFRENISREIEKRERARQYAFRRLSIAELMLNAARQAQNAETAVASQTSALRTEFGWHGEGETSRKIFAAWRSVALAFWEAVKPPPDDAEAASPAPPPDIVAALAEFERWYEAEFGTNYLAILDQEKLEYPVVEF